MRGALPYELDLSFSLLADRKIRADSTVAGRCGRFVLLRLGAGARVSLLAALLRAVSRPGFTIRQRLLDTECGDAGIVERPVWVDAQGVGIQGQTETKQGTCKLFHDRLPQSPR